jgi:hypothetical protein
MPICRRLGLWCDGFNPQLYLLHHSPSEIAGTVWIGFGRPKQEEWRFRLFLPPSLSSSSDVAWSDLVPQEELTGWLRVNAAKKELKLDLIPDVAVADQVAWRLVLGSSQPQASVS